LAKEIADMRERATQVGIRPDPDLRLPTIEEVPR
jgi:hypothetical protein